MSTRDRNREESLDRLFRSAGAESIPALRPDPGLPMRIRALAESGPRTQGHQTARWTPRWAWVSLAGAAFALSLVVGGYVGYRAWTLTEQSAEATDDTDMLMAAWMQSGFVEDLSGFDSARDEVQE